MKGKNTSTLNRSSKDKTLNVVSRGGQSASKRQFAVRHAKAIAFYYDTEMSEIEGMVRAAKNIAAKQK